MTSGDSEKAAASGAASVRRSRSFSPRRQYPLLMALSGGAVVMGLARELLLILFFGVSATTDTIHTYLLIINTVGLLADPVRLGGLNLFQRVGVDRVVPAAAAVLIAFSVAITALTLFLVEQVLSPFLVIGAAATAVLSQIVILRVVHKQRGGAVVQGHLVSVFPNVLLVPGIIVIGVLKPADPASLVMLVFYAVPVVQMLLLPLSRVPAVSRASDLGGLARLQPFVRHSGSAVGKQLFEIAVRTGALALGQGYLTILSLVMRAYSSSKAIVVDTFIGSRVEAWSRGGLRASERVRRFHVVAKWAGGAGLGLVVATLLWSGDSQAAFTIEAVTVLLFAFPVEALSRVLYFRSNAAETPLPLIRRIAGSDLAFGVVVFAVLQVSAGALVTTLVLWFLVRSALQLEWMFCSPHE